MIQKSSAHLNVNASIQGRECLVGNLALYVLAGLNEALRALFGSRLMTSTESLVADVLDLGLRLLAVLKHQSFEDSASSELASRALDGVHRGSLGFLNCNNTALKAVKSACSLILNALL